ncbi:MAG: hypothetical protein OEZ22_12525 [Spirochaetia bacterium]|nr:hypothetical protein [Spirochaetia bacterium]
MSKHSQFDKAQKIVYEKLGKEKWAQKKGCLALVDIKRQDFFIGDEFSPPLHEARIKYPDTIFVTIRIGYNAAYTTGASLKPIEV